MLQEGQKFRASQAPWLSVFSPLQAAPVATPLPSIHGRNLVCPHLVFTDGPEALGGWSGGRWEGRGTHELNGGSQRSWTSTDPLPSLLFTLTLREGPSVIPRCHHGHLLQTTERASYWLGERSLQDKAAIKGSFFPSESLQPSRAAVRISTISGRHCWSSDLCDHCRQPSRMNRGVSTLAKLTASVCGAALSILCHHLLSTCYAEKPPPDADSNPLPIHLCL